MSTSTPNVINQVFDGAGMMIEGGKAIANMAFTTFDTLNNMSQPTQQNDGMFSRRDFGFQQPQQMQQYQPSPYPWASQQYQYGYGYGQQQQPVGTEGFANPNYGKPGFFGGSTFGSGFSAPSLSQPTMSNWFNKGVWG